MNLRDLKLRARSLLAPRHVERELDEELAFHLERETQALVERGLTAAEARAQARARFGSVALAADQCRDERGTTFLDTTARDVLYGLRSFRRAPLAAGTIVATVGLGLALVAVVFTFFNAFFFRVDAVRNPAELFRVQQLPHAGARAWIPFTVADYEALRRETDIFGSAVAVLRGVPARLGGQPTNGTLVSGNFFHVLGVNAALGRTLTPADDNVSPGLPIVLSHRGWTKLFGEDPAVIGRKVFLNGVPAEVVGVAPPGFRGLSLGAPDYWAPLAQAGQIRPAWAGTEDEIAIDAILRLKPGTSSQTVLAGLSVWRAGRPHPNAAGGRLVHYRLQPSRGTVGDSAGEALMVFSPLFFAFGLILLIGCANVANLLLARGIARQREIGIRLSLGASRRRLVRQLLTESLLLALAASAAALLLSRVLLEGAVYGALSTMRPEIAETVNLTVPPIDWRVVLFVVGAAIVATALFGLLPALQTTRLELVRTIRGELVRDGRPGRARQTLIALQVTASALLLISAVVFLRSAHEASTTSPGVRTSDTLTVDVANEPLRATMLQALTEHPAVAAVAASIPGALAIPSTTFAEAPETGTRVGVGYKFVSPGYFEVLDIDLLRGRRFTSAERTPDAGVAVVSDSAARALWPHGDAIGHVVRLARMDHGPRRRAAEPPIPSGIFTVIGVVRDVRSALQAAQSIEAVVYLPTGPDAAGASLTLRVHGDPDEARQALVNRLTQVDPALGDVTTMQTMTGLEAFVLRLAFGVTVILAAVALALTLSGLFSVLSYIVEQRTKEIGVRMALGATARHVAGMVLSESITPVAAGLLAGAALAAALATVLMSTGAAALVQGAVHVFDPVAYVSSTLCIIVACALAAAIPAARAARIDPIATLRQD